TMALMASGDARQVQANARAFSQVAVDLNEAASQRDDLVDDRHAEAVSLRAFRAEKRLEHARACLCVHADSGIAHFERDEGALAVRAVAHAFFSELHGHNAAGWHRVAGVDDEIDDSALELNGIDEDAAGVWGNVGLHAYAWSGGAAKQGQRVVEDVRGTDDARTLHV